MPLFFNLCGQHLSKIFSVINVLLKCKQKHFWEYTVQLKQYMIVEVYIIFSNTSGIKISFSTLIETVVVTNLRIHNYNNSIFFSVS